MSDEEKCVCGHGRNIHVGGGLDCRYPPFEHTCSCDRFRLEPKDGTIYERAREAVYARPRRQPEYGLSNEAWGLILAALDAGEAAEKRAEGAENDAYGAAKAMLEMEANALALLNPARPEDGLLPAIRDVMQRLALAEAGRSDDDYQDR